MATASVTTAALDEKSISGDIIKQLTDRKVDLAQICPSDVKITNFNPQTNRWELQGPDDKIREFHQRVQQELIKQEPDDEGDIVQDDSNAAELSSPKKKKKKERQININAKQGDLTQEPVDAIVCPTGKTMPNNAGVAAAILQAAGPHFKAECKQMLITAGPMMMTEVRVTPGYLLQHAKHIINVVGPELDADCHGNLQCAEKRCRDAYFNALKAAGSLGAKSIAIPGISAGNFGVPFDVTAKAAATAVREYFTSNKKTSLEDVCFVDVNPSMFQAFDQALKGHLQQNSSSNALPQQPVSDNNPPLNGSSSASTSGASSAAGPSQQNAGSGNDRDNECSICFESMDANDPSAPIEKLVKCGHEFHKACITEAFLKQGPRCPQCREMYGIPIGNQPPGTMTWSLSQGTVPGHPPVGIITINYSFPGGTQGPNHIRPNMPYSGTNRTAYLPNTPHGQDLVKMLDLAFKHNLIFTVGDSVTSGAQNTVVWNGIHHKTTLQPGAPYGYPDDNYLSRLEEELASVGIMRNMIQ